VILVCTPTKCNLVGFPKGREGATPLVCGNGRGCSLLGVLDLMRIIDCSDGLRRAFGTWVFKKTCTLMVCGMRLLRSCPSLGEVQHENQFDTWVYLALRQRRTVPPRFQNNAHTYSFLTRPSPSPRY